MVNLLNTKKHILFHLGHPAHYHLFKNSINHLKAKGILVSILIKKKDILEDLLNNDGIPFCNILPEGRPNSQVGIFIGMIKSDYNLYRYCVNNRPSLMIGTSYAISHVGKILSIPSINVNEDDWNVVPYYSRLSYPWASLILSPSICNNGKWESKSIKYEGYHELAYLHPNHFKPNREIARKYIDLEKKNYIIRFSGLSAHHDMGIRGISDQLAIELIDIFKKRGDVYITNERGIDNSLSKYNLKINPLDIHHVLSYTEIFISDSQTMACESGILGVPFIRYNDFVGRISYLEEIENKFNLGFGIKPGNEKEIISKVNVLLSIPNLSSEWKERQKTMLKNVIDVQEFFNWFFEFYPESFIKMRKDPDYQYKFA